METPTKFAFIIIVLLVGLLGVATGQLLMHQVVNFQFPNPTNTTTINQTTPPNTTSQTDNQNKTVISGTRAIQIVNNALRGYDVHGISAYLARDKWIVALTNTDGSSAGNAAVDAYTGEFIQENGWWTTYR